MYEGRAEYFHFFDHCVARAAELERESGRAALCMELGWFMEETEGGWLWDGGERDGVKDLAELSGMLSASP